MSARPYIVMGPDAPDLDALPQPARDALRMLVEAFGPLDTFRSALVPRDSITVVLDGTGVGGTTIPLCRGVIPDSDPWRAYPWQIPPRFIFRMTDYDDKEQ